MAGRGPAPKPTALKLLEGNPGHQKLNRREPRPRPIAPACPTWLSRDAKREWRRIAPELERVGLLTIVDMAGLAGYCESYSLWKRCQEKLTGDGLTYETDTGYIRPRPEVAIAAGALAEIRQFCQQFGLTPSARSRLMLPEALGSFDDEEASPFDI